MEVYRSFDNLLENMTLVVGFEHQTYVSAGFIASIPKNPIIGNLLDLYSKRFLILKDGTLDMTPINFPWNDLLRKEGVIPNGSTQIVNGNIFVGDYTFFNSVSMKTWRAEYTNTTYTVHHYSASWKYMSKSRPNIQKIKTVLKVVIGFKNYSKLQYLLECCKRKVGK